MSVLENSTCSTAAGAAQWPTAADNLHARNFTAASSVFTSHQQNIGSSAGPAVRNNTVVTNLVRTRSGEGKM